LNRSDVRFQELRLQFFFPALALNSLNRCLGESDLYPFILSPAAIGKLDFIRDLVHAKPPA
jgi:hypothetical protein